jgi:hypothetical protein
MKAAQPADDAREHARQPCAPADRLSAALSMRPRQATASPEAKSEWLAKKLSKKRRSEIARMGAMAANEKRTK